jgi:hypothetical protein
MTNISTPTPTAEEELLYPSGVGAWVFLNYYIKGYPARNNNILHICFTIS